MYSFDDLYHTGIVRFLEKLQEYEKENPECDEMAYSYKAVIFTMKSSIKGQYAVSPPERHLNDFYRHRNEALRLEGSLGRKPTEEEIRAETGFTKEYTDMILRANRAIYPYDPMLESDKGGRVDFCEIIPGGENPEDELFNRLQTEDLRFSFNELSEKERMVINNMAIGGMSPAELRYRSGMSEETIQNIYKSACRKLRIFMNKLGYEYRYMPTEKEPKEKVAGMIRSGKAAGKTYREIAVELNRLGILNYAGGKWTRRGVSEFYRREAM